MNAVPEHQGQPRQPVSWEDHPVGLDEPMCEGVVVRQFILSFAERRED